MTITTTAGSKAAVVSDATNLFPGAWIAIPGLAGYFILTDVPGATVQLHRAPDTAVSSVAAAYYGPTLTAQPAAAVSGGSVAFPTDTDGNYLIDLDSLVGQGHEVRFTTTIPKLIGANNQGVKIRFTEVFLVDVSWKIMRITATAIGSAAQAQNQDATVHVELTTKEIHDAFSNLPAPQPVSDGDARALPAASVDRMRDRLNEGIARANRAAGSAGAVE